MKEEEKVVKKSKKKSNFKNIVFTFIFVFLITLLIETSVKNHTYHDYKLNERGFYRVSEELTDETEKRLVNAENIIEELKNIKKEKDTSSTLNDANLVSITKDIFNKGNEETYHLLEFKRYVKSDKGSDWVSLVKRSDKEKSINMPNQGFYFKTTEGRKLFFWEEGVNDDYYEIPESSRGEVARLLLYLEFFHDFDLDFKFPANEGETATAKEVMIKWHKESKVQSLEMNFQQKVKEHFEFSNPFVEYPWLVHIIYEGATIEDLK